MAGSAENADANIGKCHDYGRMRGTMKRKIAIILLAAMTLTFAGCGNNEGNSVTDTENRSEVSENLEGSCSDILATVYENADLGIDFTYYENSAIPEESEEYILGTTEVDFTDSVYSAPMMSSIAYQCVLLRVSEDQDVEEAKKLLEENADPIKWVCVEAESVVVENVGDVILYIMADKDSAAAVKDAFLALGQ